MRYLLKFIHTCGRIYNVILSENRSIGTVYNEKFDRDESDEKSTDFSENIR